MHPVFALAVAGLVITTAHNVLPGREERTAAMANAIEVGIEHIAQMGKGKTSKNVIFDPKAGEFGSPPEPPDIWDAIAHIIKKYGPRGLILTGIIAIGDMAENTSLKGLLINQPSDVSPSLQDTFISAPQYPSYNGPLPDFIDLGPLTPKLEIPNIVPQKPANREIFIPSPRQFWGGGRSKPVMY